MPQTLACRAIIPGQLTRIGSQASRTAGASAALMLISGPMPAGSPVVIAIFVLSIMPPLAVFELFPRHQRRVDHVRRAVPGNGPDGEVDVLQSELVRRDHLQR